MWARFKVWLARRLCRNTACGVVRVGPTIVMLDTVYRLHQYVQRSGGLQDPRRIKAYREILAATSTVAGLGAQVLIDGGIVARVSPSQREEQQDAQAQQVAPAA
jgi:hypothetical protein